MYVQRQNPHWDNSLKEKARLNERCVIDPRLHSPPPCALRYRWGSALQTSHSKARGIIPATAAREATPGTDRPTAAFVVVVGAGPVVEGPAEPWPLPFELVVVAVAAGAELELRVVAAAALYVVVPKEHEWTRSRASMVHVS